MLQKGKAEEVTWAPTSVQATTSPTALHLWAGPDSISDGAGGLQACEQLLTGEDFILTPLESMAKPSERPGPGPDHQSSPKHPLSPRQDEHPDHMGCIVQNMLYEGKGMDMVQCLSAAE